jgi:transposase
LSIEGSSETESFGLYMRNILAPTLKRGQIVLMDNLSVHTSKWVRELIEEQGCELWLLPSYSPEFNPIEEAFSKVKNLLRKAKARTLQAHSLKSVRRRSERSARRTLGDCLRTAATREPRTTHYDNCSSVSTLAI